MAVPPEDSAAVAAPRRSRSPHTDALRRARGQGAVVFDAGGRVAAVNRAAQRLLGARRSELLGRAAADVPALRPLAARLRQQLAIRDSAEDAVAPPLQLRPAASDGAAGGVEVRLAGLGTAGGPAVVATLRPLDSGPGDGAAPSGDLLLAISQALDEAVLATDAKGRLCYFDASAAALFGLDHSHRGRDLHGLIHRRRGAGGHRAEDCPLRRVLAGGGAERGEERVVAGTPPRRVPSAFRCAPVYNGARVSGAVLAVRDLSEERRQRAAWLRARVEARQVRRAAAVARRETRRVVELEEAKARFLRLASHELRGPLTVLNGYLSMVERGTFGDVSAELRRVLQLLGAKVAQMNSLVDAMLEAARLEDGRLELVRDEHDLRDLAAAAAKGLEGLLTPGHRLVLDLPDEPVLVLADAVRIELVIGNLLGNAVKYSPDGGDVICRVGGDATTAVVEVEDHGLGIDPRDQPRLFQRFARIRTEDTARIGGTGLGLYLSRELARLHEGDVEVRSAPGRGSVFRLCLPRLRSLTLSGRRRLAAPRR